MRPAELSTMTALVREGTSSDSQRVWPWRFGIMCVRRGMFERGSLRGRFVSVLIMRWEAVRWVRAEITCGALKAGLMGT